MYAGDNFGDGTLVEKKRKGDKGREKKENRKGVKALHKAERVLSSCVHCFFNSDKFGSRKSVILSESERCYLWVPFEKL
jgi:hypothetical protein